MNGLLNQGNTEVNKEQQEQINPRDQEQYDIFVANGMQIIHSEKTSTALINQIVKAEDPVEALANATLSVVNKLEDSAMANKIKLEYSVLTNGANQLMGEIIGVAEAAGMEPLNDEQKAQAFTLAVSKYIDSAVKSGKITPEQLKKWGQEASQTPEGQKISEQMKAQQGQEQGQPQVPPIQPQGVR